MSDTTLDGKENPDAALLGDAPKSEPPAAAAATSGNETWSSQWSEETPSNRKRARKGLRIGLYVGLGITSFLFFIYMTFPYGVLKEVAVRQITQGLKETGMPIRVAIGELEPSWLTGVALKDLAVTNPADAHAVIRFSDVRVRLAILPLLWGRAKIAIFVQQGAGTLRMNVGMPLFAAMKGEASPDKIDIDLRNFSLDGALAHGLAMARASKASAMVLLLPLLTKTTAGGALTGKIDLGVDGGGFSLGRAVGSIQMKIDGLFFHIDDETLKIPRQEFSQANIDLKADNGVLSVGDKTVLEAEQIGIKANGKVNVPDGDAAQVDLNLELSMRDQIEKNLGFIVPNLLRCSRSLEGGVLRAKLVGPVANMMCQ